MPMLDDMHGWGDGLVLLPHYQTPVKRALWKAREGGVYVSDNRTHGWVILDWDAVRQVWVPKYPPQEKTA